MAVSSETVAQLLGAERNPLVRRLANLGRAVRSIGHRPTGQFGLITIGIAWRWRSSAPRSRRRTRSRRVASTSPSACRARPAPTGSARTSGAATCSRSSCWERASRSSSGSSQGSPRRASELSSASLRGYFGGWTDRGLTFLDDWFLVIPFVPFAVLVAALLQDDARQFPGGQTGIIVLVLVVAGWAGTTRIVRAQRALAARAPVPRARPLPGGLARLDHAPPHPPERDAAGVGQRGADHRARGARRGRPLVPRPRRPRRVLVGHAAAQRLQAGAINQGAWWYVVPPGRRDHAPRAGVLRGRPGHRARRRRAGATP